LARAAGVPVQIAEAAAINVNDDDEVLALLARVKAAKGSLTPEERADIIKLGHMERSAFIKRKLGEKDANLLHYSDIMFSYTLVKYCSQAE
jgi:hypothetical protein